MEYNRIRIELGAMATGMFYNAQEERIQAFNRIRQIIFRKLEGLDLTQRQDKKVDKEYEKKYTDAQLLAYIQEQMPKLAEEEQEYVNKIMILLKHAKKRESEHKSLMQKYIEEEPIYQQWFKDLKGISTLNTANLLQYFGYCEKARHCSSLWKYAGFHVIGGKAPTKQTICPECGEIIAKTVKKDNDGLKKCQNCGNKTKTQLDYNPKLRTLMYRIGDCFIKFRTPKYRDIYDSEKRQQLIRAGCSEEFLANLEKMVEDKKITAIKKNDEINKKIKSENRGVVASIGHADNRARRKMVKEFMKDYYNKCLEIRGVEPEPAYSARFH